MKLFLDILNNSPVIYVTRDIERALGLSLDTPGYFIISNYTPFAKSFADRHPNIFLVQESELLDTHELLEHPQTESFLTKMQTPHIVVFKPSKAIEAVCAKKGWPLLNPPAALAQKVEQKISQIEWLGDLATLLPKYAITTPIEMAWSGEPVIVQFNHAHTGTGTQMLSSKTELEQLQQAFPNRPVRVSSTINGPVFTNNNIVANHGVMVGNISYQITGLAPFTDNAFATVGNDWALPHVLLSADQKQRYAEIAEAVGMRLKADGWKGAFGIDVILEEKTGKLFLLEINARQPASVAYESHLQINYSTTQLLNHLTTFGAHLASLLDIDLSNFELIRIDGGAQIIQRGTEETKAWTDADIESMQRKLEEERFTTIYFPHNQPGADLLRIRSENGLMEKHGVLNQRGERVRSMILDF